MKRLYAYFQRDEAGKRWIRQPGPALHQQAAIRHYQTRLIFLGGCLRPVKA